MGQLSLNEFEMDAIIKATKIVRLMSRKDGGKALRKFLKEQEILIDDVWRKPELLAFKKVEDKFTKRFKELGLDISNESGKVIP